jgi:hypothetical protein
MTEGIEINFVRVRFPNEFFFDKVKTFNIEDFELKTLLKKKCLVGGWIYMFL